MIGIIIRILYWCTLIKPSPAVDASLANITLIVKDYWSKFQDYWSKFQRQKKALKKCHLGISPHHTIRMRIFLQHIRAD